MSVNDLEYNSVNNLEYNTEREHLIIPEYGRHLQKMINYAKNLPTKEERNKVSKAIIGVMGNLQPHLRDVPDFQHKLWDQLIIMSNFELDVDSPFPKPSREELMSRPDPLKYPQNHPKYRFYGNNIKIMIDAAKTFEEGDLKDALIYTIANHMKKCYLNWNKDSVEDEVIFNHLRELSGGEINLKGNDEDLTDASSLMRSKKKYSSSKKSHHKKGSNRNKKRY
ncbi:MAG TPA: DUF4290 domain-containing protein [Flavobacteriaceae bacterium]|nr:DUF4290 domain-containing protein [Flavobacteriaceae bacterium]